MSEGAFHRLWVPVLTLFGFRALRVEDLGDHAERSSAKAEPVHLGDDPLLRKVGNELAVLFFPSKRHGAGEISRPFRFEFGDAHAL